MSAITTTGADLGAKGVRLEDVQVLKSVNHNGHSYKFCKYPDKRTAGRILAGIGLTLITGGLYGLYALVASRVDRWDSLYSKKKVEEWISNDSLDQLEEIPTHQKLNQLVLERDNLLHNLNRVTVSDPRTVVDVVDQTVENSPFSSDILVARAAFAKKHEAMGVYIEGKADRIKRLNDNDVDWLCDDFLPKHTNLLRVYESRLQEVQGKFSEENWAKIEAKIAELKALEE